MAAQYVAELISPIIADTTQYALRNIRDLRNISTRTTISQKFVSLLQYIFGII